MRPSSDNSNCLFGLVCPDCGQSDSLTIGGEITAMLSDDGVEEEHDFLFSDYSTCQCPDCGARGIVADFRDDLRSNALTYRGGAWSIEIGEWVVYAPRRAEIISQLLVGMRACEALAEASGGHPKTPIRVPLSGLQCVGRQGERGTLIAVDALCRPGEFSLLVEVETKTSRHIQKSSPISALSLAHENHKAA